jgi:hypothetical protein
MQKRIDAYDKLPIEEQKRIAKRDLIASGIIDENDELSERYPYSRELNRKLNAQKVSV